jgi:hypothetical protein
MTLIGLPQVEARWVDNNPSPVASFTPGDRITAGTAHTKTAYTTLRNFSSTPFAIEELWVAAFEISNASGLNTSCLLDIAFGSGDTIVVPNLAIGYTGPPRSWVVPCFIPKGVALKARMQIADITRPVDLYVAARPPSIPWHDHMEFSGRVTAYGPNTGNSQGVQVTAGNAAYGTFTTIGTTTRNHRGFLLSVQGAGNLGPASASFYTAVRFGTSGNPVISDLLVASSAAGYVQAPAIQEPFLIPIPSGTTVQIATAMSTYVASDAVLDFCLYGL